MRVITALTIAVWLTAFASPSYAAINSQQATQVQQVHSLRAGIRWQRGRTWHFQDIAGVSRTRTNHVERRTTSVQFLQWVAHRWNQRRLVAKRLAKRHHARVYAAPAGFPPHHALWTCIASNEGPWNDNDGGYDGGLQMSQGWLGMFSGSAGNYSEAQQEWFAEKAWAQNGYSYSFLYGQWFEWDNASYCYGRR